MRLATATYHYLRDPVAAMRPGFDALPVAGFAGQLDYFARHYNVVHPRAVSEALSGGRKLPPRALLLAFDDGLKEHITVAHQALRHHRWSGVFYVPVASTQERSLLLVHKVHLILSRTADRTTLAGELRALIDAQGGRDATRSAADYYAELARKGRYDDADTVFVKRVLQRALPRNVAQDIADVLLKRHVGKDLRTLAEQHYLSTDEVRTMAREGQEIGGHGVSHSWLDAVPRETKVQEIDATARFLADICSARTGWSFSYPYGRHDPEAASLLRAAGCTWAVSTEPKLADLARDDPFCLPRLDTNDFPRSADAPRDRFVTEMEQQG